MSESFPDTPNYATVFAATVDSVLGLRQGGTTDRNRNRAVYEERVRIARQKPTSCFLVNMNRFPLYLSLGDLGTFEVPACPAEKKYIVHEIKEVRISMRDTGEGNFNPVGVVPNDIAQEFVREYGETGGVFAIGIHTDPFEEELRKAEQLQVKWFRREYQKAVDSWTRYRQHKFITDRQRDAARSLAERGELSELPEWVTLTNEGQPSASCPACGEDIKPSARVCRHCGYHLDPSWMAQHSKHFTKEEHVRAVQSDSR